MTKQPINIPEALKVSPADILLHACCAPCSSAIVEWMLANGIRPTIFYYNPNIFPREEYEIRKNESKRHADTLGLRWIDGDYDHDQWQSCVKGFEAEPERGSRCLECFRHRLLVTAWKARELGIAWFTTTLASSRWKSLEQITEAGQYAESQVTGTHFWAQNWRKGGLYERRNQLLRQYNFYNQQYCGCEYSMRGKSPAHCQELPEKRAQSDDTSRRAGGKGDTLYRLMNTVSSVMDRFYLDGIIGLLPLGIGDVIGGVFALIHLYFAAFRIRSWSLTMAILNNALRDILLGLLPFFVGDVIDFFHRANSQNMQLINGFIHDNETIIRQVNRKARQTAAICVLLLLTIVLLMWLLVWLAVKLGTVVFS